MVTVGLYGQKGCRPLTDAVSQNAWAALDQDALRTQRSVSILTWRQPPSSTAARLGGRG